MQRVHAERVAALGLLLFSLAYFVLAFGIKAPASSDDSPFSARSFPLMLGPLGMGLSLILLLKPPDGEPLHLRALAWGRALGLIVLMGAFALLIGPLGFVVTSALFLAGGFILLGERRPVLLAGVALGVSVGFYLMFTALGVGLDWGLFGRALS
jgi:putative tricarboxylic transport membrane protein